MTRPESLARHLCRIRGIDPDAKLIGGHPDQTLRQWQGAALRDAEAALAWFDRQARPQRAPATGWGAP